MTGTSGLGESIRKGVGKIHGTGEAIRGSINAAVDDVSGDHASAAKNKAIADKGVDEWDHGYQGRATDAGVTPADTDRERLNTTQPTSTNYGPHDTNTANKLDPRYDSDMDHRGTATGSTNIGPHSTNVGNKLDPRIDSDADHRANSASGLNPDVGGTDYGPLTPSACSTQVDGAGEPGHGPHCPQEHRGLISDASELEPAHKLDPVYHVGGPSMKDGGPHSTHVHRGSISGGSRLEAAEKLDPPADVSKSGPCHSQPQPSYHQPKPTRQSSSLKMLDLDANFEDFKAPDRADTEPLPQDSDRHGDGGRDQLQTERYSPNSDDELDRHARRRSTIHQAPQMFYTLPDTLLHHRLHTTLRLLADSTHLATILEPQVESTASNAEPHSIFDPHKNMFVKTRDPKGDRDTARKSSPSDHI